MLLPSRRCRRRRRRFVIIYNFIYRFDDSYNLIKKKIMIYKCEINKQKLNMMIIVEFYQQKRNIMKINY